METSRSSGNPAEHNTLGKLSDKVTIPAMSECIASIYQEDEIIKKILMVHSTHSVAERYHLAVDTSVDNTNQETLNCRLINPSAEDITLPEDTSIAHRSGLPEGIAIKGLENSPETKTDRQDKKINSISKKGDVMT